MKYFLGFQVSSLKSCVFLKCWILLSFFIISFAQICISSQYFSCFSSGRSFDSIISIHQAFVYRNSSPFQTIMRSFFSSLDMRSKSQLFSFLSQIHTLLKSSVPISISSFPSRCGKITTTTCFQDSVSIFWKRSSSWLCSSFESISEKSLT